MFLFEQHFSNAAKQLESPENKCVLTDLGTEATLGHTSDLGNFSGNPCPLARLPSITITTFTIHITTITIIITITITIISATIINIIIIIKWGPHVLLQGCRLLAAEGLREHAVEVVVQTTLWLPVHLEYNVCMYVCIYACISSRLVCVYTYIYIYTYVII